MPRLNLLAAAWAVAATTGGAGPAAAAAGAAGARQGGTRTAAGTPRIDATPRPPGRLIWLHAASVGETMSILPVLPALAEAPADDIVDHRHRDFGDAAGAAAGPGAGRPRAAPFRAARRAGLGRAVP